MRRRLIRVPTSHPTTLPQRSCMYLLQTKWVSWQNVLYGTSVRRPYRWASLELFLACRRNLLFHSEGLLWQPIQGAFLSQIKGGSILEVFLSLRVSLIPLAWIWLGRWLMLHKAEENNRTYPWKRRLNPCLVVIPFLEFVDRFQQRFRWFGPFSFDAAERDRAKGRCG